MQCSGGDGNTTVLLCTTLAIFQGLGLYLVMLSIELMGSKGCTFGGYNLFNAAHGACFVFNCFVVGWD